LFFFLTQGYDVYRAVHKYYGSQNGKSEDAYGIKLTIFSLFKALILASLFTKQQPTISFFCIFKDMRKSMSRDKDKITMKPTGKTI